MKGFYKRVTCQDHNKYAIRLISIGQLQNRDHMIIVTILRCFYDVFTMLPLYGI